MTIDIHKPQPLFIFVVLAVVTYYIGRMLQPFLGVLLAAWVVYALCLPTYKNFVHKYPRWPTYVHASLAVLLSSFFLLAPFVLLGWMAIGQARQVGPTIREWNETLQALQNGQLTSQMRGLRPLRAQVAEFFGVASRDVQAWLVSYIRPLVDRLDTLFTTAAGSMLSAAFGLFLFVLLLFFLFRDGSHYAKRLRAWLPMDHKYQDQLFARIDQSVHIILKGWGLCAVIQGATAMLGFALIQLPGAVLLGTLAAFASLIPYIGTSLVWMPAVIVLFMQGQVGKGLFLLLWGGVLVSLVDNLVAPILIQRKSHMPLPLLLLAIIGGVSIFGFKGLLLGPLLVLIAPTLLDIYRHSVNGHPPPTSSSSEPFVKIMHG